MVESVVYTIHAPVYEELRSAVHGDCLYAEMVFVIAVKWVINCRYYMRAAVKYEAGVQYIAEPHVQGARVQRCRLQSATSQRYNYTTKTNQTRLFLSVHAQVEIENSDAKNNF